MSMLEWMGHTLSMLGSMLDHAELIRERCFDYPSGNIIAKLHNVNIAKDGEPISVFDVYPHLNKGRSSVAAPEQAPLDPEAQARLMMMQGRIAFGDAMMFGEENIFAPPPGWV